MEFSCRTGMSILLLTVTGVAQAAWWDFSTSEQCLTEVEKQAQSHQACLVIQAIPGQCDDTATQLANARQTCEKETGKPNKVKLAEQQGKSRIPGKASQSPYARITRSLKRAPYFIRPARENYLTFTNQCRSATSTYYKVGAYHLKDKKITFIVYPLGFKCADKSSISEKFPVVTGEQLGKLGSGEYLNEIAPSERPFTSSRVVQTSPGDLRATYKRIASGKKEQPKKPTSLHRLNITTQPEGARIRLVNNDTPFENGMKLPSGKYLIEISAPGYQPRKQWVHLRNNDHSLTISLKRGKREVVHGLPCLEHSKDIQVSTVRIAPFDDCHFITYPDERSRDLAITNLRETGYIHDVHLEVTYYDENHEVLHQEKYIVFRASNKQAIAPGETRFPFTRIYLKREDVKAIGIKTVSFSVSQ